MREVFDRLRKGNLSINVGKCKLGQTKLKFLSHIITSEGFRPPERKVEAVRNFKIPRMAEELKMLLGMTNFYRPFLQHATKPQNVLQKLIVGSKKKDSTTIKLIAETLAAALARLVKMIWST